MSGFFLWTMAGAGLGVVVVRRRSVAIGLVTLQALLLCGQTLANGGTSASFAIAAAGLFIRAVVLAIVFLLVLSRTRESVPVRASVTPLVRGGAALCLWLILAGLAPPFGLSSRDAQLAAIALICFGLVTAATRRATLFQLAGLVVLDNGLALAALSLSGGGSLVIELGAGIDLVMIALVGVLFHQRIFTEFGAGDTARLRSLRE
jgi:hydrogenase-4 component E